MPSHEPHGNTIAGAGIQSRQGTKTTPVDTTTLEQKQDPELFHNCYPELFELDYLRTLPRRQLHFNTGIQGLDLRQHVAQHAEKEGDALTLADTIAFTEVEQLPKESLLVLLKKSRLSLTALRLKQSPILSIDALGYLMSSFRKLTVFDFTESNINDLHLQTIYQRPRYLKNGVNNAVAVEELCLRGNGGITDEGVSTMIKADACRWLTSLDLSECPNISDMVRVNIHLHSQSKIQSATTYCRVTSTIERYSPFFSFFLFFFCRPC